MGFHLSQGLYDINFQTDTKEFSPVLIRVQWISLTHEQSHFLYQSVQGVLYYLINVVGHFSVILQP